MEGMHTSATAGRKNASHEMLLSLITQAYDQLGVTETLSSALFNQLDKPARAWLSLYHRYVDGMSQAELAGALDISHKTLLKYQQEGLAALREQVQTLRETQRASRKQDIYQKVKAALGLPDNGVLYGREPLRQTIRDTLAAYQAPGAPHKVVAIEGLPGLGKTSLAYEAAACMVHYDMVDDVVAIKLRRQHEAKNLDAGGPEGKYLDQERFWHDLCQQLNVYYHPTYAYVKVLKDRFAQQRILLVADGVNHEATYHDLLTLLPTLCPSEGPSVALITATRSIMTHDPVTIFDLDELTLLESYALLTDGGDWLAEDDLYHYKTLYQHLGGVPQILLLIKKLTWPGERFDLARLNNGYHVPRQMDEKFMQVYGVAWDALSEAARRLFILLNRYSPEEGYGDWMLEVLAEAAQIPAADVQQVMDELRAYKLLTVSEYYQVVRYQRHSLTRAFAERQTLPDMQAYDTRYLSLIWREFLSLDRRHRQEPLDAPGTGAYVMEPDVIYSQREVFPYLDEVLRVLQSTDYYLALAPEYIKALAQRPRELGYASEWNEHLSYFIAWAEPDNVEMRATRIRTLMDRALFREAQTASLALLQDAQADRDIQGMILALGLCVHLAVVLDEIDPFLPKMAESEAFLQTQALGKAEHLEWLMVEVELFRRAARFEDMDAYLARADAVFRNAHDLSEEARGNYFHTLAIRYWIADDFEEAHACIDEAMRAYSLVHMHQANTGTQADKGLIYWSQGEFLAAERMMTQALSQAHSLRDRRRAAIFQGNLALVYLKMGHLQAALENIVQSIHEAGALNLVREELRAIANRGVIHMHLGNLEQAEFDLLHQVEELVTKNETTVDSHLNLARLYEMMNDPQAARQHMMAAWDYIERYQNQNLALMYYRVLAELTTGQEALEAIEQAIALAEEVHRRYDLAACYLRKAQLLTPARDRKTLWEDGCALLTTCGGAAWLEGKNIRTPLYIPAMI